MPFSSLYSITHVYRTAFTCWGVSCCRTEKAYCSYFWNTRKIMPRQSKSAKNIMIILKHDRSCGSQYKDQINPGPPIKYIHDHPLFSRNPVFVMHYFYLLTVLWCDWINQKGAQKITSISSVSLHAHIGMLTVVYAYVIIRLKSLKQ